MREMSDDDRDIDIESDVGVFLILCNRQFRVYFILYLHIYVIYRPKTTQTHDRTPGAVSAAVDIIPR